MKKVSLLALTFALLLTGCSLSSAGAPTLVENNGPESASPSIPVETASIAETAAPTPMSAPGTPNVYTDWSKLEDRGTAAPRPTLYERWHGEFTDHLIPSPDYGPLIPFSGPAVDDDWGEGYYALDGLMTLEGKVVVDPVYAAVTRLGWGGFYDFGIFDGYHPAYLLSRYVGEGSRGDPGSLFGAYDDVRSVLCAADGSWVTPEEYRFDYGALCYGYVPEKGGLFGLRDGNVLAMLDMNTGREVFSVTLGGLTEEELSDALSYASYGDGRVILKQRLVHWDSSQGHTVRCWDLSGNEILLPDDVDDVTSFSEALCPARQASSNLWGYLDTDGEWAISPQFSRVWDFDRSAAQVELADVFATTLFIDPTGAPFHSDIQDYDHVERCGDHWYDWDVGRILDRNGNELSFPALRGASVSVLGYGWAVMEQPDGSRFLLRGTESWPIPAMWDDLWSRDVTEDAVFFTYCGEYAPGDSRPRWLMWRPEDGDIPHLYDPRVRLGALDEPELDPVSGEKYLRVSNDDGTFSILTLEGETLFEGLSDQPWLYGGRCLTSGVENGSRWVELRDPDGKLLFSRQWASPFD